MQLVAPNAVRMAVATDAMICTIHLQVSFFVIVQSVFKMKDLLLVTRVDGVMVVATTFTS